MRDRHAQSDQANDQAAHRRTRGTRSDSQHLLRCRYHRYWSRSHASVARALASESMQVVVNYSANYERANNLVKDLSRSFPASANDHEKRFTYIKADLEKRAEVVRLLEETVAIMGRPDVVVSNRGWTKFSNFADLDAGVEEADRDRCLHFNVKSHLFLIHAAKEYLDETEGAFITTASLAGVKPSGSSPVCFSYSGTSPTALTANHVALHSHMP